jgi:short-subunit dehydrogenase
MTEGTKRKSGVALVTGAAAGLGAAFTANLISQGWSVVALDRDREGLARLSKTHGDMLTAIEVDFSKPDCFADVVTDIHTFTYDLVIHNAGISATGRFEEIPADAHLRLLQVNARAPIELTNMLLAAGRFNDSSRLVFISSLSHAVGYPGAASYGASKDAIASYGASLRKKLKKHGLKVCVAFPGPLRTDHAQRHAPEGAAAEKRMAPEEAARIIIAGAKSGKAEIYPGFAAKAAAFVGRRAPVLMAKLMRKAIYDKLDRTVAD